jgi:hypothetical protein
VVAFSIQVIVCVVSFIVGGIGVRSVIVRSIVGGIIVGGIIVGIIVGII